MSILQEYEAIKKEIGKEKWESIDTYINTLHPELRLDQIIYNSDNWIEFEKWFYKEIKLININILGVWKTDYDDYRAYVEISNGEIKKGSIIASYDEGTIRNLTGNLKDILSENGLKDAFTCLICEDFDSYLNLPKISECSKLLQVIYDNVRASDSSMCHISKTAWNEFYIDKYSDNDIKILEEEIKKYGLEEIIEIDDNDYKIIGYGDLETRFNDDSNLINNEIDTKNHNMNLNNIITNMSDDEIRNTFDKIKKLKNSNPEIENIKEDPHDRWDLFDNLEYDCLEKLLNTKKLVDDYDDATGKLEFMDFSDYIKYFEDKQFGEWEYKIQDGCYLEIPVLKSNDYKDKQEYLEYRANLERDFLMSLEKSDLKWKNRYINIIYDNFKEKTDDYNYEM